MCRKRSELFRTDGSCHDSEFWQCPAYWVPPPIGPKPTAKGRGRAARPVGGGSANLWAQPPRVFLGRPRGGWGRFGPGDVWQARPDFLGRQGGR